MTYKIGAASVGGSSEGMVTVAPAPSTAELPPSAPSEPNPGTYFDRMQAAVAAVDAGVSLEDQVREVAESVSDAPVSGDESTETPADTAPTPDQTTPEPTQDTEPKTPIDYAQLPDNIRAELRRANLAPEVKEALAQSWYERKAFHDVGFSVEQARYLKSVGFSPEVAVDRLRMHPTVEDAAQDAGLANIARTLINDFQSNPQAMIDGLEANAPEAFPQFAQAIAARLPHDAPEVYHGLASNAMFHALQVLESELGDNDFEERASVKLVRDRLFPNAGNPQQGQPQPGAFNPNDPIHQKYKALQDSQQQAYVAQASTFAEAVQTYSQQAVLGEVSRRVADALPRNMDPSVVQRAASEITELVAKDFFGNRGVMESITSAVKSSDLSQASLNAIVDYAYNRAVPLIAVHSKPVLEFWQKTTKANVAPATPAITSPQRSAVGSRTVATAPSAARIPAASPPVPGAGGPPPKEFIASGRKQGWDTGKIISAWLNGQR